MKRTLEPPKDFQPSEGLVAGPAGAEAGFTLMEVVVAMVILLVALLGVFGTFTYAINYNAGNNSRSQALAVLQQEVELMRSIKFTPNFTEPALTGGVKASKAVASADGNRFRVDVTVDNDPFTSGLQTTEGAAVTIKEVKITVTLENPSPGWQTAVPSTVVLRRVRAN
jgi:prepilin-type N-terminal cleavage/methylation domain-containing protein